MSTRPLLTGNGGEVGNQGPAGGKEAHPHEATVDFEQLHFGMEFCDDMKGWHLDRDKVVAARRPEIFVSGTWVCTPKCLRRMQEGQM